MKNFKKTKLNSLLVIALAFPLLAYAQSPTPKPTMKVAVEKVNTGQVTDYIDLQAKLVGEQSSSLKSTSQGILQWVSKPGQRVKKGEILATYFMPEILEKAILTDSLISDAQKSLELEQDELLKSESFYKEGYISEKQLKQQRLKVSLAKTQLDQRKIEKITASSELKLKTLIAPSDGFLGKQLVKNLDPVVSGQILASFKSNEKVYLEFEVPLAWKNKISTNSLISHPKFSGNVISVSPSLESSQRIYVKADVVTNYSEELLEGEVVLIRLYEDPSEKKESLKIKRTSVVFDGDEAYVFLLDKKDTETGKVNKTRVDVIKSDGSSVEVKGIKESDLIVTKGAALLKDLDLVSIEKGN